MVAKQERSYQLLHLLMNQRDFITSEDLAEKLGTSTKTIYRLVRSINEEISDGTLIVSEKGRGYRLDYDLYAEWERRTQETEDLSPRRRRFKITRDLLFKSPDSISVYEFLETYFIGESVLAADENLISQDLEKYQLRLIRKNRSLAIEGAEADVRRAMLEMIQQQSLIDIEDLKNNVDLDLNMKDVGFVLKLLEQIEQDLDKSIPYPYNINIFLHLYIFLQRHKNPKSQPQSAPDFLVEKDSRLYRVAQQVIEQVAAYLRQSVPEDEIVNLYQYLTASRMEGGGERIIQFSEPVARITQSYLDLMHERLQFDRDNQGIFTDLANHIKPMLKRLEQGIAVKNGLLSQIELIYPGIYQQVSEVSEQISQLYSLPPISADENGFITLYFAKLIELSQQKIRTLIVCTTGVGTSELLRAKIERNFADLEIMDVLATKDLRQLDQAHAGVDLIITTVALPDTLTADSLLVSGIFTADDQARLQRKIEAFYGK